MADNITTVGLEIKNEKVRKEMRDIVSSVEGFSVQISSDVEDCDILVMELGEDCKRDCQNIAALLNSGSVKDIFLVLPRTEPEVLLQAMRSGAREFFPMPINKADVANALLKFKERNKSAASGVKSKKRGKIINIVGSKGGIGTTTIAVNFAASLMELQGPRKSVALIDMNLLFGDIPLFLDIESAFNWGEVVRNISRLDSTYLMSILSKHPSGLYFLPSPTQLEGVHLASSEIIQKLLHLMQKNFDYIVIDSGQSLDEVSLKVLQLSDTVFVNAILSLPCLVNVKRLLETFRRLEYPAEEKVGVVINRYHKNSLISLKEAEKGIGKRIFWQVPNDFQTTISAINQGKTLAAISGKAEITQNISELASKFCHQSQTQKEKKSFFSWQFLEAKS
ncbi:MAG: response regulator receiver protein [Nitrospirae bacterium]|nr:response regulator receiver protein [Nitrospirota bacterium]